MSGTIVERPDARTSAARVRGSRRQWLSVVVALVVVVAVAIASAVYWHWRHNAHDLYAFGGRITLSGPVPVSMVAYVNAAIAPSDRGAANAAINVHTVAPHITVNSAGARVEVLTCKVSPQSLMPTIDTDTSNCLSVARLVPGDLELGNPGTQILIKVTAKRAGDVRIDGTDISYSNAHQSGRQRVGIGTLVHFTRPSSPSS